MKRTLMTICLIGGLAMLWSCNDDKVSYPVPSDIENLKATPAPGQITLSWTNPADENLYYVQIEYTIEALGKSYTKQVSQYSSEFVLDNIFNKYGEINFTVQAFNRGNMAGPVHQISAQAEKAAPTFGTPEKLTLSADGIWTNAPFPTRKVDFLIDGNTDANHFFHSQWSTVVKLPHYLVFDLGEEVDCFQFRLTNNTRTNATDSYPHTINIYASDSYDPEEWFDGKEFIDGDLIDVTKEGGPHMETKVTDLPDGQGDVYTSENIPLSEPFRYLWFEVTEVSGPDGTNTDKQYFSLAEFEIFKVPMVPGE